MYDLNKNTISRQLLASHLSKAAKVSSANQCSLKPWIFCEKFALCMSQTVQMYQFSNCGRNKFCRIKILFLTLALILTSVFFAASKRQFLFSCSKAAKMRTTRILTRFSTARKPTTFCQVKILKNQIGKSERLVNALVQTKLIEGHIIKMPPKQFYCVYILLTKKSRNLTVFKFISSKRF